MKLNIGTKLAFSKGRSDLSIWVEILKAHLNLDELETIEILYSIEPRKSWLASKGGIKCTF